MDTGKLSVIVLCRNMKNYLSCCIDSILGQQYENLEVLLINDCASDPACEVMGDYHRRYPERIAIDIKSSDLLIGAARNRGLSLANGEFVTFVDGDDWLDDRMYQSMMPYFADRDVDMVVCDFNECLMETGKTKCRPRSSLPEGVYTPIDSGRLFNKTSYAWNSIVRRSLIDKIGFHFPEGVLYEDLAMHLVFAKSRKIAYVPRAFYQHRKHAEEITNVATSSQHCMIVNAVEWLAAEFGEKVDMTVWGERFNELLIHYLFHYVYLLMMRGSIDMNVDILQHCAETFIQCGGTIPQDIADFKLPAMQLESPRNALIELRNLNKQGKEVIFKK